ncbi:MAG: Dabb family protein [Mariniphaga sp.]|nr:Dabb family protein [Mariniphaga sp.]
MNQRRAFLKKITAGIAITSLLPFSKKTSAAEIKLSGGLMHHVFFWLKEPKNEKARAQFEKGLEQLLKIETIQLSHIGVPASTESRDVVDNSYSYSYMVMFKDQEAHDIYQEHPLHLKFIEQNSMLWEKVIVYDTLG